MTTLTTATPATEAKRSWLQLIGWGLFFAVLAWSWQGAEMNPLALVRDAGNMATFAADFFPPDFSNWQHYLKEMVVTVQIALWGTVLAIVCAIPLGILCSENIVPWWIYQPVRRVMDACRSINEMVFAMLFVVAVGLGPFAGVLALFISTTGVLAKLFAEAVEAIDPGPVEGVRATGASALQEVIFGVIPQVLPLWISYSLYRFESNVRSATVVGMVGAGGIGVILWEAIRGFQFAQLDIGLGQLAERFHVFRIVFHDLAIDGRGAGEVTGFDCRFGLLHRLFHRIVPSFATRCGDEPVHEVLDLAFRQGALKAVDRAALKKGVNGRDRLNAPLWGEHLVFVAIDFDELDLARRRGGSLFQSRRKLFARAAPFGPKIHHNRRRGL